MALNHQLEAIDQYAEEAPPGVIRPTTRRARLLMARCAVILMMWTALATLMGSPVLFAWLDATLPLASGTARAVAAAFGVVAIVSAAGWLPGSWGKRHDLPIRLDRAAEILLDECYPSTEHRRTALQPRKRQGDLPPRGRAPDHAMAPTPNLRYVDPHKRRGRLYLAVCRFSTTKAGLWIAEKVAWKLDPLLLKLTTGRFSTTGPVASALLETRGARTGQPRRNVTLYFHDGDRVTIIASKQGGPKHPAWYYNLREHLDVVYGGLPFRAEIVQDERERQRLWDLADRVFPQFADYRAWAGKEGRVIPIVQMIPANSLE
jgi:deazaflavin-dependent oxidoreductase (nitroreductase family)